MTNKNKSEVHSHSVTYYNFKFVGFYFLISSKTLGFIFIFWLLNCGVMVN